MYLSFPPPPVNVRIQKPTKKRFFTKLFTFFDGKYLHRKTKFCNEIPGPLFKLDQAIKNEEAASRIRLRLFLNISQEFKKIKTITYPRRSFHGVGETGVDDVFLRCSLCGNRFKSNAGFT